MGKLYDSDIVAWAAQQVELLRARKFDQLDLDHIVEEIEDVGKSERRELTSRCAVLIAHLLKWQFQPERRGNKWYVTIVNQRERIALLLQQTPSLRHVLEDPIFLVDAWKEALSIVHKETGLYRLPKTASWSVGDLLDRAFFPDSAP